LLESERAFVVHGAGGIDEFSATGANFVAVLTAQGVSVRPADTSGSIEAALHGGDAQANAHALSALLDGGGRAAYKQAVLANASVALQMAGFGPEGEERARASLESGAAKLMLEKLIAITKDAS